MSKTRTVKLKVGDKIPGSQYVRDFCRLCRDPIRVSEVGNNVCIKCMIIADKAQSHKVDAPQQSHVYSQDNNEYCDYARTKLDQNF